MADHLVDGHLSPFRSIGRREVANSREDFLPVDRDAQTLHGSNIMYTNYEQRIEGGSIDLSNRFVS